MISFVGNETRRVLQISYIEPLVTLQEAICLIRYPRVTGGNLLGRILPGPHHRV